MFGHYNMTLNRVHDTVVIREGDEKLKLFVDQVMPVKSKLFILDWATCRFKFLEMIFQRKSFVIMQLFLTNARPMSKI